MGKKLKNILLVLSKGNNKSDRFKAFATLIEESSINSAMMELSSLDNSVAWLLTRYAKEIKEQNDLTAYYQTGLKILTLRDEDPETFIKACHKKLLEFGASKEVLDVLENRLNELPSLAERLVRKWDTELFCTQNYAVMSEVANVIPKKVLQNAPLQTILELWTGGYIDSLNPKEVICIILEKYCRPVEILVNGNAKVQYVIDAPEMIGNQNLDRTLRKKYCSIKGATELGYEVIKSHALEKTFGTPFMQRKFAENAEIILNGFEKDGVTDMLETVYIPKYFSYHSEYEDLYEEIHCCEYNGDSIIDEHLKDLQPLPLYSALQVMMTAMRNVDLVRDGRYAKCSLQTRSEFVYTKLIEYARGSIMTKELLDKILTDKKDYYLLLFYVYYSNECSAMSKEKSPAVGRYKTNEYFKKNEHEPLDRSTALYILEKHQELKDSLSSFGYSQFMGSIILGALNAEYLNTSCDEDLVMVLKALPNWEHIEEHTPFHSIRFYPNSLKLCVAKIENDIRDNQLKWVLSSLSETELKVNILKEAYLKKEENDE